jgi:molybdopterin converting factor small subunit
MFETRWPLAALLAAALAGCGDEALDREALGERAGAICAKYAEQGRELGSPDLADPAQAREYFGRAEELARRQQSELEELEPADDVAADYARLTDATEEAVGLLGDLADAAEDEDRARGVELAQRLAPLTSKVDAAARAIGADDCAS